MRGHCPPADGAELRDSDGRVPSDVRQRDAEFKNQDSFRDGTVERPLIFRDFLEDQNTFINKCMELLGTIILLFVRLQSNHETALLLAVRPPTKRCAIYTIMHFFLNNAFHSVTLKCIITEIRRKCIITEIRRKLTENGLNGPQLLPQQTDLGKPSE